MAPARDGRADPSFTGSLLSATSMGDVNRSRLLQALCDHGPLSRADLARMAGVTRATIGGIVNELIAQGLVEELEPRHTVGQVGKPARPVWFAPAAGLCGAAALSRGSCEVALVNARGEVLDARSVAFDPDATAADPAAEAILRGLRAVLPSQAVGVLGVGIAVPGMCDSTTGTVIGSSQLPGLQGTALIERLATEVEVPLVLDNDARAQALGEKWFGDGRGVQSFAAVQTGHGLGLGLVLDGVIVRGDAGYTGEVGHTCVVAHGGELCRCGLHGCWETVATLSWLRAEAQRLGLRGAPAMDAASLRSLAMSSNAAAGLLNRYADNLAIGLANLAMVISPERIILHGDAVGGGEPFRSLIDAKMRQRTMGPFADRVALTLSALDQRAALLGAAGVVLSETFRLAA